MINLQEILVKISEIIRINSAEGLPEEGAPFGRGPKAALDSFLSLANEFGFETKNYEGYAGEVTFGEGEEFAVLAHLDVVPAGSGWTHDPFGGEIDYASKRVWGRGATDDKGPAIITLFALKSLKDKGFKPKRKIKLIVGCNEETGWRCIDYYKAHAHMPDEGFSPDADFPVIYAEKGILHIRFAFGSEGAYINGGERANMVCDCCEAVRDGKKRVFKGKSAHGSTPEQGVNAIEPALKWLGLDKISDLLFSDGFGLKSLADESGKLTFSPNVATTENGKIYITVDIRYPATMKKSDVLNRIEARGAEYEVLHDQAPLFNDKHSFLIDTLCSVYNEVTGRSARPVAIGGGTYARALKFGAAFGPEEEGDEAVIHMPDEYISFEKVEKCFKIYELAIKRLTE